MSDNMMDAVAETTETEEIGDLSFLETTNKDAGYDEKAEPGARGSLPPEGKYLFQFSLPKFDADDVDERTGLNKHWKVGTTKPNKKGEKSRFIGGMLAAMMLRPAGDNKMTLEEFDEAKLANRKFSKYISTLFMYGRSGVTDYLKCVVQDVAQHAALLDASAKASILAVEETIMAVPEGIGEIKWGVYFKDPSDDKTKRIGELSDELKKKYSRGASTFPKDSEGHPLTRWNLDADGNVVAEPEEGQEVVEVFVLAELDNLLPFKPEA